MDIQELIVRSEQASQLLTLLANPSRLRILCVLQEGEQSVTALGDVVDLSQSALSQHLAKFREAGIVSTRREAQSIYYSIADTRVARLLEVLAELFCKPEKAGTRRRKTS
jgi:DNA-binding transcriptional ArsR family regulator